MADYDNLKTITQLTVNRNADSLLGASKEGGLEIYAVKTNSTFVSHYKIAVQRQVTNPPKMWQVHMFGNDCNKAVYRIYKTIILLIVLYEFQDGENFIMRSIIIYTRHQIFLG
jgi:hypothetical protein